MGNYLGKNEEQILQLIRKDYEIEAPPYLLHKQSQQLHTLHKITAKSIDEVSNIKEVIEEYQKSKCESISKLKAHYHLDNTGYCSDEQYFYLIFDGQNNYCLREQFLKRKLYRSHFTEQEIQSIITTYLCGLREYSHRFRRQYENISLDYLVLDQKTRKISLKDPWLTQDQYQEKKLALNSIDAYPSPEKLSATYQNRFQQVNQFLSVLFSVGVIALQLNRLQSADSIYVKKRSINFDQINIRIRQFRSEKIRKGISCLLNIKASQRRNIYQIWNIENKESHFISLILNQKYENLIGFKDQSKNQILDSKTNKFQFLSTINKVPLVTVPSQTIMVPQPDLSHKIIYDLPKNFKQPGNSNTVIDFSKNYNHFQSFSDHQSYRISGPNNIHDAFNPRTNFLTSERSYNFFPQSQRIIKPQIFAQRPNFHQILAKQSKNNSLESQRVRVPLAIQQPGINLNLQTPANNNISEIINNNNFNPLAEYKQSFIYYEPLDKKIQSEQIRSESIQTRTESPKNIIKNPPYQMEQEKKDLDVIQVQINKQNEIPILSEAEYLIEQKDQPNLVQATVREINNTIQKQEQQKSETPQRPPNKNKFNSTIVQVRDEDSPQHSSKSQENYDCEYVVEEYESGSRYEGQKRNNMRNGEGKFHYQDGGYYEGQWRNNKMDGYGRLYYEGGKLAYQGSWSQDEFNGYGKVYNDNPVTLHSEFDYTNFDLLEDYWVYYEGMLIHDTKQGRGKIMLSNNQHFEGDFHNDRIQGFGKFYTLDGHIVEGIWRQSKLIKIITNTRS